MLVTDEKDTESFWEGHLRGTDGHVCRCGCSNPLKQVLLSKVSSRPALGSTQPPIQWVPGALSRG
jgi:hypothetical protein